MTRAEREFEGDDADSLPAERRPRRLTVNVVFHDDDLIVVDKPPGVWPDRSPFDEPSVAEHLSFVNLVVGETALPFAYPLDPPVSGLMVVARNSKTTAALTESAACGSMEIVCLAIVRGPVTQNQGTVESRLRCVGGRMRIDERAGNRAVTSWAVKDRFIGFTLLECRTNPVLPHQIRFQLDAAGLPLAVDPLYGGATALRLSSFKAGYRRSKRHEEKPLIDRVTLHVHRLSFVHPSSNQRIVYEAAMPKDFRAALHQLSRFGRIPK